jgi:hypothetical protein
MSVEHDLATAIAALDRAGIDTTQIVLGIVGEKIGDETHYDYHVGRALDRDNASMLHYVAKELVNRSNNQLTSFFHDESMCPSCGSDRVFFDHYARKVKGRIKRGSFNECWDCGWRQELKWDVKDGGWVNDD